MAMMIFAHKTRGHVGRPAIAGRVALGDASRRVLILWNLLLAVLLWCAVRSLVGGPVAMGQVPGVDEMIQRHKEIATKYRGQDGVVALDRMPPDVLREYLQQEQNLTPLAFLDIAVMPSSCDLGALGSAAPFTGDDVDVVGNSRILAKAGTWRFLATNGGTMLPVPKGWQVYGRGAVTDLFFPPFYAQSKVPRTAADVDVHDTIHCMTRIESVPGIDEGYQELEDQILEETPPGTVVMSDEHRLNNDAGFLFILSKTTDMISLFCYVPVRWDRAHSYFIGVNLRREKWPSASKLLTTMFNNWCDLDGHPLLAGVKWRLSKADQDSLRIITP